MKKKEKKVQKKAKVKKPRNYRLLGALSAVAFMTVLVCMGLGLSGTIGGIKEEIISKSPDAILASAGLDEDKDVYLSVMYYDQRSDNCINIYDTSRNDALRARQFEWSNCGYHNKELEQGMASYELSEEKIPVLSAGKLTMNRGLGSAERWFMPVEGKSASYLGTLGLKYEKEGTDFYFYRDQFYPLDEVKFSEGDVVNEDGHNHLFTLQFVVPFTVIAGGSEKFEVTADDDTFVYVGERLAIDMGGIHDAMKGSFEIHEDGEVYAGVGGEEMAFTGIRLTEGEGSMVRIFHADRDSDTSVFGVKFSGMNIAVTDASKLAKQNGGVQVAYDPTDSTYEAPLGQSVVMQPDHTRGYVVLATIEGVMIVVFAVLVAIAARIMVKRKAE